MTKSGKSSYIDAVRLRPLQRAIQIMRSAPSTLEGIKEIVQKALDRVPASNQAMREAKTAYWQDEAKFKSFVEGADAERRPGAAYMDAVINEFFLSNCPENAHVLDVGCGHGIVSIFLARHGRSVTACDVSEPMVEELKKNSADLDISVHRADAYNLPFSDNEFDTVVSRMFLYQFPDWPKILKEMTRCCRRGGQLLIHFTSKENLDMAESSCAHEFEFELTRASQVPRNRPGIFCGAFSQRAIDKACRKIGLRVVERAPCMFFHYNRLIGHSLGTEKFETYKERLSEHLKDPHVLSFVTWFEKTALQFMPAWISYYNILVLEKL